MNYLLDTNMVILYGRDSEIADRVEEEYKLFTGSNNLAISIVTLGELNSLAKQLKYGERRIQKINSLVDQFFKIDINFKSIIEKYGEIDAFSLGKLENKPLGDSSKNMGKNDLWIAATSSVFNLKLVTTDKDFDHLNGRFLNLEYIYIEKYRTRK